MKIVDFKLYEPYLLDYLHGFSLRYRHAHFLALVQKGLLSGTATQEQIEQAMDRLSASVGSHIACLESQPMPPIEHPAVQALLEGQAHALPAKRKKPYSPEGLTLYFTPLADPIHQAWAVTEPVQRDSSHNRQRATKQAGLGDIGCRS